MTNLLELPLTTFDTAIKETKEFRRHLFLGNGFSISVHRLFGYESLYLAAKPFSDEVDRIFKQLHTNDFEAVLHNISNSNETLSPDQIKFYDREVREAFLNCLTNVHPLHSMRISVEQVSICAEFLKHFVGADTAEKGRIYTTNYDLLLYWVIVRAKEILECHDGFRYGKWSSKFRIDIVYLHGALHIFQSGSDQIKISYNIDDNLIPQIKRRVVKNNFPTIVAERTSEEKKSKMQRNQYLREMKNHFRRDCKNKDAVLFTYGHSFDRRDGHFLELIGQGNIRSVYVGAYQGLRSRDIDNIEYWASTWSATRKAAGRTPPEVWIYDTSQCKPWG